MKTQQTLLMVTLLGAHGGEVLFVVVVLLQPRVVQEYMLNSTTPETTPISVSKTSSSTRTERYLQMILLPMVVV